MRCPTVKIKSNTGSFPYSVINESDFDPEKGHVLWGTDDIPEPEPEPEPESVATSDTVKPKKERVHK